MLAGEGDKATVGYWTHHQGRSLQLLRCHSCCGHENVSRHQFILLIGYCIFANVTLSKPLAR